MKSYSIGREQGCDIIINDDKDVVSRRHAVLNVYPFGKMTIVDHSKNGTYVNGIRITSNEPVPVTRKDIVSFAHFYQLDWSKVPSSNAGLKIAGGIIAALIVLAALFFGFKRCGSGSGSASVDSIAVVDSTEIKAREKAIQDSIEAAKADSIAKVKTDSILKAKDQEIERLKKQGKKAAEKAKPAAPSEPKEKKTEKPAAKPIG